jgi:hypothetical protein
MNGARKMVAATGLIVAALALWFAVLLPLAGWKAQQRTDLADAVDEQARLTRSIAALQAEKTILSGNGDVGFLWRSAQLGTANAEVQSAISDLAAKSGISLRSITPLPPSDGQAQSGTTVAFRIESEAALDALKQFLSTLEYNDRALVVRSGSLRRLARPEGEQPMPVVFFQLDVIAPVTLEGSASP